MGIKRSVLMIPVLLLVLCPMIMAEEKIDGIVSVDNIENIENDINVEEDRGTALKSVRRIAFSSKRDGNFEIYTINEDGSGLKRLTSSKNDDMKPQWSPDGQKIMYLSKKGKEVAIRVMNDDGSGQVEIARNCVADYLPLWSPDSTKVLFMMKNKSKTIICRVDADGGNLIRLTERDAEGMCPSWSADGQRILCLEKYKRKKYIYIMNSDGTERVKVTKNDDSYREVAWSPDNSKIAYISTKMTMLGSFNQIMVMDSNGANDMKIAEATKLRENIDYKDSFSWSPDGKMFTFTKVADVETHVSESGTVTFDYFYGAYIVGADGNDYDRLLGKTGSNPMLPDWSPDSSRVAVLSDSKLVIYNLKTKIEDEIDVKISLPLSTVRWSPDGKKLVFAGKNHSFQKAALIMATLDGKVTKLTEDNDYDPVWSPAK
jgi:Tol biopolymer transport system component